MNNNRIKTIVNDVLKKVLNEAETFKPGESIVIGGNEALGRKIIKAKYGLNPDDFEFVGGGKFIYKPKGRGGAARQAKPKKEKEFLGRKEGESEQEYLDRIRELNKKFVDAENEIEGEQWRPVVNTGRYRSGNTDYTRSHEVSNMGRLRTIDYEDPMRSRISIGYDAPTRKAMQFHLDAKTGDGEWEKTTPPVHTMVADAWLDAPEGNIADYDVEHIDGNYHNNRADNLRYVLRKGRRGRKANAEIPTETPFAESIRRMIKESVRRALNERVLNEVGETDTGQNLLGQVNKRKRLGRKKDQAKEVDDYARSKWDKGEESWRDSKIMSYWEGQDKYRRYQKGRNIIKALKQLNFEDRGHEILDYMHEYPAEIAITNINVPAVADCREIAQRFNVEFYTNEGFGLGIFEL